MIVYVVTNLVNGKSYIGQTVKSLKVRWRNHCSRSSHCLAISNAIQKYGKENFSVSILGEYSNLEELNIAEEHFIQTHQTLTPHGYNVKFGGNNCAIAEETKKKMSEANSGDKNFWFGKKLSKKHNSKISQSLKGRKRSTPQPGKSILYNETGEVFVSISEAARKTGFDVKRIKRQLAGRAHKSCPFTFSYIKDNNESN